MRELTASELDLVAGGDGSGKNKQQQPTTVENQQISNSQTDSFFNAQNSSNFQVGNIEVGYFW